MTARRPEIIGHGGAGHFYPGNSQAALEAALRIGVDRIEFDVQRAADGHLVLVHDDKLQLPNGALRPIRAISTPELRELLPGLLTFDDAIELIAARAAILIDVKSPGYEREIIAAIQRHRLGSEHGVSSTYATSLRLIRRGAPGIRIGLSTGHLAGGVGNRIARRAVTSAMALVLPTALGTAARLIHATDLMVQHRVCTERLIRHMHSHGLRVTCWTVDSPHTIRRMAALGVDGITSNRPDLVRDVFTAEFGGVE